MEREETLFLPLNVPYHIVNGLKIVDHSEVVLSVGVLQRERSQWKVSSKDKGEGSRNGFSKDLGYCFWRFLLIMSLIRQKRYTTTFVLVLTIQEWKLKPPWLMHISLSQSLLQQPVLFLMLFNWLEGVRG